MTKLLPKNINGTIANNKIIKKLDDNTFAEVTASDITALGVGGDVSYPTASIPLNLSTTGFGTTTNSTTVFTNTGNKLVNFVFSVFVAAAGSPTSMSNTLQVSNDGVTRTNVFTLSLNSNGASDVSDIKNIAIMLGNGKQYKVVHQRSGTFIASAETSIVFYNQF